MVCVVDITLALVDLARVITSLPVGNRQRLRDAVASKVNGVFRWLEWHLRSKVTQLGDPRAIILTGNGLAQQICPGALWISIFMSGARAQVWCINFACHFSNHGNGIRGPGIWLAKPLQFIGVSCATHASA